VYNIDGTLNEAGSIQEVVDVVLRYRDHSEQVQFAVTGLGKQDAILGYTWLKEHNQKLTGLQRRSKCRVVRVAAVPAGRRLNRTSPTSDGVRIKYDCEHSLFQAWPVQEKWSGYTCCSGRSLLCCLGMNPIHNARFVITSKLDYYCYYKYCYYKLPLANSGMGLS